VPFDLDVRGIVIPARCPVLGIKIEANTGGRSGSPNSPSLDRYDPAAGYVVGNVAVISNRANQIKSDATADEMAKIVLWMELSP